ncbi:MAG: amidohydrolase family protein [Actinomycetota bacterium]|nr:MAG: Atz/Trz family [Actinomycetota bacterium]MDO8950220.1 amidohydrolase family protein [Actinomycetota bacterium]MDP3630136.1 amidohydrolase family protein [Actinomycetota bacterium]
MILAGEWLLPVSRPPIRHGAVRVAGPRIVAIGTLDDLKRSYPADAVHVQPGCVIAPGLVNAHTHLSLTSLRGLFPPGEFPGWIARLAPVITALDEDDYADAVSFGALECLRSGVTVVGDIAFGPEAPAAAADAGVGGVFFWEVLGGDVDTLAQRLDGHDFPTDAGSCDGRTLCGLSPHSPYTSGPGLMKAVYQHARRYGYAHAIHIAESTAEIRLLAAGEGALRQTAERLAVGFTPPGTGGIRYLEHLGVLKDSVAIHCVQLMPGEAELLAAHAAGVVLCPRSNRYLLNGRPPVTALREAGARMAVGTDSLASNESLDLFAETRELLGADPGMTAKRALAIMTLEGAQVLGAARDYGSLEVGKYADVISVAVEATADPVETLVREGTPSRVRSVISAGVWRVIDGKPAFLTAELERKNARVAEKAARALNRT